MTTRGMVVLGLALATAVAAAQTYTVQDASEAANKCAYRLRFENDAFMDGVAFSADGIYLYLSTRGAEVRILQVDAQTGHTLRTLTSRRMGKLPWIQLVSVPSGGLLTALDNGVSR
jgi:hypothetical protein